MSGSVTSVQVQLSPAECARLERQRRARNELRPAFARTVTVAPAQAVAAREQTTRTVDASARRTTERVGSTSANRRMTTERAAATDDRPRTERARSIETGREEPPRVTATPRATATADHSGSDRGAQTTASADGLEALRVEVAQEALEAGFPEIAAQARAAADEPALLVLTRRLDDAIDARETRRVLAAHVEAAGAAVLGTAWTPRPATTGQRTTPAGDRISVEIAAEPDGWGQVEIAIDSRSAQINDRPAGTCEEENRITREILLALKSDEVVITSPPLIPSAAAARLGGLSGGAAEATRSRALQEPE